MFNNLNKKLSNKQLLSLMSQQMRCLKTRSGPKTTTKTRVKSGLKNTKIDSNNNNNKYVTKNIDYLGIFDSNYKEVSGLYDNCNQIDVDKYKDLLEGRDSTINEQKYMTTSFGRVRLDSENTPKLHGHYDPDNNQPKFDIKQFEDKLKTSRKSDEHNQELNKDETNIFEEQYFDQLRDKESKRSDFSLDDSASDPHSSESELGFVDKQYFSGNANIEPLFKSKFNFRFSQKFNEFLEEKSSELESFQRFNTRDLGKRRQDSQQIDDSNSMDKNSVSDRLSFESPLKSDLFSQNFELNVESTEESTEYSEDEIEKHISEQKNIKLEEEVTSTANKYKKIERTGAQYLNDIQSGKVSPKYPKLFTKEVKDFRSAFTLKGEKLDSKGYRILSGQVLDYTKLTHEDIVRLLMDSILFDDADIVAINKPYGMTIHSKESDVCPVLTQYLPQLCKGLKSQKLYTVHRLDRDTTGVLLLAKTQEKAKQLNRMFVEHSIIKRYLCITRGVPDQHEGIIDIPIEMGMAGNKERMVLRPEALEEYRTITRPSKTAKRAVTQYKVVSYMNNSALIEVWPKTGVRHQIRVHLGFGIRCPILGDHKYSHLERIAPQKLTNDMLLALNVRQSKVRYIPLHLHAMQYCLPNAGIGGGNIFINAPIPHHFHKNMSNLKLRQ